MQIVVPSLIVGIIMAIIAWFAARSYERKQYDSKVGSAEENQEK